VAEATAEDAELVERIGRLVRTAMGAEAKRVAFLPGQLGLRRFARVELEGAAIASLVARIDAPEAPAGRPPGIPPEPPLETLRALLERHALPVPACYGSDDEAGIALLEDVGSLSLRAFARDASASERRAIYREACGLVPRLQRVGTAEAGDEAVEAVEAFGRRLDGAHFAYKAQLFCAWSLPLRGRETSAGERSCVEDAFAAIAREAERAPVRLAHRDFQSANLHLHPSRSAPNRLMMIDLQGALLAPPEYDLVCLLCDSYVELPKDEIEALLARVRPLLPDAPEPADFARRFDLLAIARKAKDHARFVYADKQRGDSRYLVHVPLTLRQLRGAAARSAERDPHFAALAELIGALPESTCAR
jgi:aminoglycoside/choline kinase family phosphotransferase